MRNLTPPITPSQVVIGIGAGIAVIVGVYLTATPTGGDNGFTAGLAAFVVAAIVVTGIIVEGSHRAQMERIAQLEEQQAEILRLLNSQANDMHNMSEAQLRLMRILADGSHILSVPPSGQVRRSN
jgi:hypothetical protein